MKRRLMKRYKNFCDSRFFNFLGNFGLVIVCFILVTCFSLLVYGTFFPD